MKKEEILAEQLLKHYIDEDSQVTVVKDPGKWSTGNGLLHTGFAVVLLNRLNIKCDYSWAKKAFELAEDPCQPGVFDRNKNRNDRNAHDDYYGIVGASSVMNWRFHVDVLKHGQKNFFIYENVDGVFNITKDWWAFRLRFPFVILWYYLANKKAKWLRWLFKWYLKHHVAKKHCSGIIKSYCALGSLVAIDPKYWSDFEKEWLQKHDLEQSCLEYFIDPEHPLVKLSAILKQKVF